MEFLNGFAYLAGGMLLREVLNGNFMFRIGG